MSDYLVQKAQLMYDLKVQIDELNDKKKVLQAEYDAIRNGELPGIMESRQIPTIRLGAIERTVYLFPMVSATMPDKAKGMEWLEDNGYGDIIVQTVPHQSLTALVKEQIKQGEDFPEDLFDVKMWDQARLKK